jgi:hypothetical protein
MHSWGELEQSKLLATWLRELKRWFVEAHAKVDRRHDRFREFVRQLLRLAVTVNIKLSTHPAVPFKHALLSASVIHEAVETAVETRGGGCYRRRRA